MEQTESRSATWSTAVTLAAIGGFLAAAGVFLGWWHVDGYRQSEIFGRELVREETLAGTAHWTGLVALLAGLVAGVFGIVALVVGSEAVRRAAGVVTLLLGVVVVVAAAVGMLVAGTVAETSSLAEPGLTMDGAVALGLFVSGLGGVLTAVGGAVAGRTGP